MPIAESQLSELKHAYQILGVPPSASAPSIKQTHRKLIKRWHPDLYVNGTSDHAEATRMTKMINEAYMAIHNAPLRYYIEPNPLAQASSGQAKRPSTNESTGISIETLPKTDRLEFWVRFVCGALFGILVSFRLALDFFDQPAILATAVAAAIVGLGFAAARYGDKFWYSIFRHWWFWS
jgi:DnaJ domain